MERILKTNRLLILLYILLSFALRAEASTILQSPPYKIHVVQPQETVYSIARRNGVSEEDIYKLNPGSEMGIRIGQELRIPTTKSVQKPRFTPSSKEGFHIVQHGETLYSIAKQYGVTVAILLQYNPDITPEYLQAGAELRVSLSGSNSNSSSGNKIVVVSPDGINKVDVALLLPVGANGPSRYIQFYEGFLLGLYQLKRNGISVNLNVYQAQNEKEIESLIRDKKLQSSNLIVGGHTEQTVNLLSRYSSREGIPYVSPFIAQNDIKDSSQSIFRINTPQKELYPYVAKNFTARYGNKKVLFIEDAQGNHKELVAALKKQLRTMGRNYETCTYAAFISGAASSTLSPNTVLVPNHSAQKYLQGILTALESHYSSTHGLTIFGYPEWQSFHKGTLALLGAYNGTIYSSFFFDRAMKESVSFLKNYNQWFNRKANESFPKYNVLGYDLSRYFIRALAIYGANFADSFPQLPSDGLQMNFVFKRHEGDEHYTSVGLFFITFDATGKANREGVTY